MGCRPLNLIRIIPAKESQVLKRSLWQEISMDPAREGKEGRRKYISFRKRLIAVAAASVIIVAGFAIYQYSVNRPPAGKVLNIYTYDSFMKYGENNISARNTVFQTFAKEFNITVNVHYIKSGLLLSKLENQKNNPQADVVIGLTNMNGVQAVNDGLILNYTPPAANFINSSLKSEMGSASGFITPYEYSYLGIDYNKTYFETRNLTPTFADLSNSSMAGNLLMQYPSTSDTGLGFLLWEISYYKYILDRNWTTWWLDMKPYTTGHFYSDWSTSFQYYDTGPGTRMLVSYLTDPAYNTYFGYGNSSGSTLTFHDSKAYGWRTIYGLGIINGSSNIALDREFINYFLSPTVQNLVPQNEWMYPANGTISLPASFNSIQNFGHIYPLNNYLNATEIANNYKEWEFEWSNIMQ